MNNTKQMEIKIDSLIKVSDRDAKRLLISLKKDITSFANQVFYEANYNKRLCVANYNKLLHDIENLNKENFSLIIIKIPDLQLNSYINLKDENNLSFINELKKKIKSMNLRLCRNTIYSVADFLVMLAYKNDVNDDYKKIKRLKLSKKEWQNFQMTYIKYIKSSAKINKNICNCLRQATAIFKGEQEQVENIEDNV